jgi:hypothetical protein
MAAGALKEKNWNQYRISLEKNKLTIQINGAVVAEQMIEEPATARFFSLFRYIDKTKCRVRNVVYRGDWPKELPGIDQQQLAYPPGGPFQLSADNVSESIDIRLNRSLDELKLDGLSFLKSATGLSSTEKGLRIQSKEADSESSGQGVALIRSIPGDFEATVEFTDLSLAAEKDGGEAQFAMRVFVDDPVNSVVELGVFLNREEKPAVRTLYRHDLPNGGSCLAQSEISEDMKAGHLRIVRRGDQFHCLISDNEEGFRLLHSYALGKFPGAKVELLGKSAGAASSCDVVVIGFSLKTAEPDSDEAKVSVLGKPEYQFSRRSRTLTMRKSSLPRRSRGGASRTY